MSKHTIAFLLLQALALAGCGKAPRTKLAIENSGPDELEDVVVTIEGRSYALDNIPVGGSASVSMPPIGGKRIEVAFRNMEQIRGDGDSCYAFGSTPDNTASRLVIVLQNGHVRGMSVELEGTPPNGQQCSYRGKPTSFLVNTSLPPLHQAASRNDAEQVRRLIASGASPGEKDKSGLTALHVAASSGNVAALRALLDSGADPNAPSHGITPPLAQAACNANVEAVSALLEAGANPDLQDGEGRTPLFYVVFIRDGVKPEEELRAKIIEMLLSRGCSVNPRDATSGHTALDAASSIGNDNLARLLKSHGAVTGAQLDAEQQRRRPDPQMESDPATPGEAERREAE